MTHPRRIAVTAVLTGLCLVLLAAPAAADGGGPTSYRSEVTSAPGGVRAWVFGGDAYLVLEVEPGLEVLVPGYEAPEQYLRFAPDGRVFVNVAGPTYYANQDRYQQVEIPDSASPEADPEWQQVADGGTWAWHDHRIHWMSPSLPRHIDPGGGPQAVFDWSVPLVVDGQPASIEGTLVWEPPPPVAPLGLSLLLGLVGGILVIRRLGEGGLALTAGGAFLLVAVAVAGTTTTAPHGAGGNLVAALVPAGSVALVLVVAAAQRKRPDRRTTLLWLGAIGTAVVGFLELGAALNPVVPGWLAPVPAGILLGLGIGAALGALGWGLAEKLMADLPDPASTPAQD